MLKIFDAEVMINGEGFTQWGRTVPFRSATVSTAKRGFFPFRNGRKRAIRMGERNGTVPLKA